MPAKWQQWMPLDIEAFMSSPVVQAMRPAARSGFMYLLMNMWQSDDCALSSDDEDLMIASGMGDEWEEHRRLILKKFIRLETGKIQNLTLLTKWLEAKRIFEARQDAAKKTTTTRSPNGHRVGQRTVTEGIASRSADTTTLTGTVTTTEKPKEVNTLVAAVAPTRVPETSPVEEIYKAYPRKEAKQDALKAITRAIQRLKAKGMTVREAQEFLFRTTQAYARSPAGNAGNFTPHAATWFNGGRYDDDQAQWAQRETHGRSGNKAQDNADSAIQAARNAIQRMANTSPGTVGGDAGNANGRPGIPSPALLRGFN